MKKATLAILMALSIAMTLSGCGESSSASTDTNESSSSSAAGKESSVAEESKKDAETNGAPADETMNWNGITLYHPAKKGTFFDCDAKGAFLVWEGCYTSTDKVHYLVSDDVFVEERAPQTPYYTEVAEHFDDWLSGYFLQYFDFFTYDCDIEDWALKRSVETEEDVQIEGYSFRRYTGTIRGVNVDTEEVSEFPYCALYGIADMPELDKTDIPIALFAFAESNDPAAISDAKTMIDKAIEYMEWDKE